MWWRWKWWWGNGAWIVCLYGLQCQFLAGNLGLPLGAMTLFHGLHGFTLADLREGPEVKDKHKAQCGMHQLTALQRVSAGYCLTHQLKTKDAKSTLNLKAMETHSRDG